MVGKFNNFVLCKNKNKVNSQGVLIADKDAKNGNSAVLKINNTYGTNKAIFVETDVTKADQLEGII